MYYVVDESKLSSEAGYLVYTAGTATSVPWSGVTGKPSSYPPASHNHDERYYTETEMNSKLAEKAPKVHTHVKSEVGLGNVDNTADANKSVKYATSAGSASYTTKMQTYKLGSTSETYGTQYPLYAQWEDSTNLRLKCDGYTVKTSYSDNAGSATKATQDSAGQQINTTYIKGLSVSGRTITYTKGDGTTGTITTQDTNTWRPLGTTGDTACAGNDSRLSNARPASDVYSWAKASSKPSYSWGEITGKPSTFAPASHTHNYAGSSSAGGNANAAVKLATARSINGTNFDGSGNITTANWGTARTITVGNTGKSVNGSGNVSWSLGEIGVHVSNKEPAASDGKNGDVWIVYEG